MKRENTSAFSSATGTLAFGLSFYCLPVAANSLSLSLPLVLSIKNEFG